MLTCNLLTSFSLVNGKIGTLHGIVWRPGNGPYITLPCMLLFIPDHYPEDGPCLFQNINNHPVVPLLPITWTWDKGSCKHSRTMFPVVLAYAITIHKFQSDFEADSNRYFQTGFSDRPNLRGNLKGK